MAKACAAGRYAPAGSSSGVSSSPYCESAICRARRSASVRINSATSELSDLVDLVEALLCDAPFCGGQCVWEVRAELSPVSPGGLFARADRAACGAYVGAGAMACTACPANGAEAASVMSPMQATGSLYGGWRTTSPIFSAPGLTTNCSAEGYRRSRLPRAAPYPARLRCCRGVGG